MLSNSLRLVALLACLVLLPIQAIADAKTGARLMAAATAEAARIPDGAARTRTVLAIARIQHEAGLDSHARDALRQTAEAIWQANGDQPPAVRDGWRAGLLAETAETACSLGFKDDAARILDVAEGVARVAQPTAKVRLLRAAILCQNGPASEALWRSVADGAGGETVLALAGQGLAGQAEALWRSLQVGARQVSAPATASTLARLGYIQAARRIDPNVQAPGPEEMLPELLAQAEERRLIGDKAGSAGFLQAAARQVPAAPAYAPALAAAYAALGDIARADAALRNGGDSPASRASLAAAYAKAGDVASARRILGRLNGPAATPAFAAIAKAGKDAAAAASASRVAESLGPGRAKAEALAHAAAAAIAAP